MRNYTRILSFVALFILAVVLLFMIFQKEPITENNVAKIIEVDKQPVEIRKDQDGLTHASKPVVEVDGKIRDAMYKGRIDSFKRALGVTKQQLQVMISISGTASGNVPRRIDTVYLDTTGVKSYVYKIDDEYLTLRDTIPGNGKAWYQMREKAHLSFYHKKSGFLGLRNDLYADVYSENKQMKYDNIQATKVPEKKGKKVKTVLLVAAGVVAGVLIAK